VEWRRATGAVKGFSCRVKEHGLYFAVPPMSMARVRGEEDIRLVI